MNKILLISTGGTFNKVYDSCSGKLIIDKTSKAVRELSAKWLCDFKIINIVGKDSLDMNNHDRLELLAMVSRTEYEKIIIIHGTDTMDITAKYLADAELEKQLILTGAMVPYSIDPVEATANLASSFAYMQTLNENGIFISMNGIFGSYESVIKDKKNAKFIFA